MEYFGGGFCFIYGGGDFENIDCLEEFMELLNGEFKIMLGLECMGDEWMLFVGDVDFEFIEEVLFFWLYGMLL